MILHLHGDNSPKLQSLYTNAIQCHTNLFKLQPANEGYVFSHVCPLGDPHVTTTWDLRITHSTSQGPTPSASDIWWPSLETSSNVFTSGLPHPIADIWWLLKHQCKRAVHILLECCLVTFYSKFGNANFLRTFFFCIHIRKMIPFPQIWDKPKTTISSVQFADNGSFWVSVGIRNFSTNTTDS